MRLIVGTPEGVQVYRWLAGERRAQLKVEAMQGHSVTCAWATEGAVFCGTETGRLYVSRDRGESWAPRFRVPGQRPVQAVSGRHRGEALYVGVEPAGVFISTDGGGDWEEMESFAALEKIEDWKAYGDRQPHVQTLAPDPLDEERLYAGVEVGGAYRSEDGGRTWRPIHDGLYEDVHMLEADPIRTGRLYAATGGGLYVSQERGEEWVAPRPPIGPAYCTAMRLSPEDPERDGPAMLLATAAGPAGSWGEGTEGAAPRLFLSHDGANSWSEKTLWDPRGVRDGITALAFDLEGPGRFFAGTSGGEIHYALEEDGGWVYVTGALPPVRTLAVV
ncbi:MAG: hypothetical protein Q8W51_09645 [Candidatus Palauibacterales bacterium]|nr:hypothetical protein [Candidatus Palauibacterales bacterium]MDP2529992.1 hypothetical protein [Candidatus Palauibacterales bacterium]MDP2585041.1 hypothetical protein [Candidatus Palauibacterales bacterium]